MAKACSCPPDDFAATECPVHGLYGDVRYEPMDRHALTVAVPLDGPWIYGRFRGGFINRSESAAQTQRRLYAESLGFTRCWRCWRTGTRGFMSIFTRTNRGWIELKVCRNVDACARRWSGRAHVRHSP